jgi:predicted RNase H-like HicB family nuclease
MPSYIALIRKEPGSDYGVEFPDFPGCITAGVDLDDARRMAAEALALHIQGMLEDGETLPAPSQLRTGQDEPHQPNGFLGLHLVLGALPAVYSAAADFAGTVTARMRALVTSTPIALPALSNSMNTPGATSSAPS